ncbi:MAG: DUF1624 domain-containing protein [Candidatus Lokiarchaeota archaeon]|nr:DUF1624 domain-containing protein [Candidatus Lokiarchaeota archaeon]
MVEMNKENKVNKTKKLKERIESIDIFKGLSMFWIIGGHCCFFWVSYDAQWLYDILLIFFWTITGVGFIWLSGMNLAISVNSKQESSWSEKQIKSYTLKRIGILIIFSFLYNFMICITMADLNWQYLGAWFVLQTISASMLILIFLIKTNNIVKILISFIIIFGSHPLYSWLMSLGSTGTFLYYLFFFSYERFPFLPWTALAFIGYVVGDYFYKAKYNIGKYKSEKTLKRFIFYLIGVGAGFLFFGIISGLNFPNSGYWAEIAGHHVEILNRNPYWNFSSLPYFLLKGHWSFFFYSIGIDLLLLGILTYYSDYLKRSNKIFKGFSFTGKFSLSVFFYHHIGIPLFPAMFGVFLIWPIWISYAVAIIAFVWLLVKKFGAKGTVEWVLVVLTYNSKKKIQEKISKNNVID